MAESNVLLFGQRNSNFKHQGYKGKSDSKRQKEWQACYRLNAVCQVVYGPNKIHLLQYPRALVNPKALLTYPRPRGLPLSRAAYIILIYNSVGQVFEDVGELV